MDVRVETRIASVPSELFRRLESPDDPFATRAFLGALESSGAASPSTGWAPCHLVAENAFLPAYLKTHSYGEFIFDWEWAQFYKRNGVAYYPKIVSMVPFTPATGARILAADTASAAAMPRALIELAVANDCSSAHALFLPKAETAAFAEHGFLVRNTLQFHWENRGYRDFADYLSHFVSKRRRDVERERRQVAAHGLAIECLTGPELATRAEELGAMMFRFYETTIEKKESNAYLPPAFFAAVFAAMPDETLLVVAKDAGTPIAAALNFFKGSQLFGRYWGTTHDYPGLHFELCYYQTIEWAIARKMRRFEAGAQGAHKIQRGFLPSIVYSAHWLRDARFREPIAQALHGEAEHVRSVIADVGSGPFGPSKP